MSRVVITSHSLLSPLGNTEKDFSNNLFSSYNGVSDISQVESLSSLPMGAAAFLYPGLSLPKKTSNSFVVEYKTLLKHLYKQFITKNSSFCNKVDALLFSSMGEGEDWDVFQLDKKSQNRKDLLSYEGHARYLAQLLNKEQGSDIVEENVISICNACVSGNILIGQAFQKIRSGYWEKVIVGGLERLIRPGVLMPYLSLGVLSQSQEAASQVSCPFSINRTGFVKAEGGFLIGIESLDSALKSNSNILAEVLGCSNLSQPNSLTAPDIEPLLASMQTAMADAGMVPKDLSYINAHGSSTLLSDKVESLAIKQLLGDTTYSVPVSSTKSQMGHANVACGGIEAIASILMLGEQKIGATINYEAGDADCDLDYVAHSAREHSVETILSNSIGFGGLYSSIILKQWRG